MHDYINLKKSELKSMRNWVTTTAAVIQWQKQNCNLCSQRLLRFESLLLTLYGTPLCYLCPTVTQQRTHVMGSANETYRVKVFLISKWEELRREPTSFHLEVTRHDIKIVGKYRSVNSFPGMLINILVQPWCNGSYTEHNPPQLESLKEIPWLGILTILLYYPGQRMLHPLVC